MHEGHRQRLISKLIEGNTLLSDHEILEILLFYSIPRKNVNELAHRILDNFGTLKACLEADYHSLLVIKGVGHKTATFLVTIGEIFKRSMIDKNQLPTIFNYDNCKKMLIDSFKPFEEEKFVAFYLNKQGEIILRKIFCSHSDNMVNIDIGELLKGTLVKKPHSVVICHNHLSGNCKPSYSDDRATEKIYLSLKLNNITLYDHIIIADDNAYSYRAGDRLDSVVKNVSGIIY